LLSFTLFAQTEWREVKHSNGVRVFTRPSEGSPLDEFKGVTIIDAPLEVIVEVIRDVPAQPEWMADCIEARVVKQFGENDYLVYSMNSAPWPVSNRDVIVRSKGTANMEKGTVSIIFTALKDSPVPIRAGVVRITDLLGQWHLKKISSSKTEVIFIIKANPAGNIPASIANMSSREIPYRTLLNLKKMAKKEKYINGAREKYHIR
jgi:hypothetical protein